MNVLVTATTHFASEFAAGSEGDCRLERNDVAVSNEHPVGELTDNNTEPGVAHAAGMQVTDVEPLAAGTYTFEVSCSETAGKFQLHDVRVSAVELSQD
jgi:hypothetical protein